MHCSIACWHQVSDAGELFAHKQSLLILSDGRSRRETRERDLITPGLRNSGKQSTNEKMRQERLGCFLQQDECLTVKGFSCPMKYWIEKEHSRELREGKQTQIGTRKAPVGAKKLVKYNLCRVRFEFIIFLSQQVPIGLFLSSHQIFGESD